MCWHNNATSGNMSRSGRDWVEASRILKAQAGKNVTQGNHQGEPKLYISAGQ